MSKLSSIIILERSLIFIKPEFLEYSKEIWNYLDNGLRYGNQKDFRKLIEPPIFLRAQRKILEKHYAHIRKYINIYEKMIKQFSEEGIELTIYEGIDIINRIRRRVGPTDPQKAEKNTIRGRFSNDSLDIAREQNRPVRNVIHASDDKNAEKEIKLWSDYLKLNL